MIDLKSLPHLPGCYLFKNEDGVVMYVGKAKDLKKRVSNYFQKRDLDPKTENLVQATRNLDFIVTNTEVEAFLLENTLIKKHLGWEPSISLRTGMKKTYDWISEQVVNENRSKKEINKFNK